MKIVPIKTPFLITFHAFCEYSMPHNFFCLNLQSNRTISIQSIVGWSLGSRKRVMVPYSGSEKSSSKVIPDTCSYISLTEATCGTNPVFHRAHWGLECLASSTMIYQKDQGEVQRLWPLGRSIYVFQEFAYYQYIFF